MPRTDPSRSSESATRHLFRHFFDERELLRNPFIGEELRSGRVTLRTLHARLANAAVAIEREDRAAGNSRRGRRLAACLLECTLKRRPLPEVAASLGLSQRQLFRERQLAWTRAVGYLVASDASGPNEPSAYDALCNEAAQRFMAGDRNAVVGVLERLQRASSTEAGMFACLIAELYLTQGDYRRARAFLDRAHAYCAAIPPNGSTICTLNLQLLGELLGECRPKPDLPQLRLGTEIADGITLERNVRWWMVRLATRLLIVRYRRALDEHNRSAAMKAAHTAIALGELVPRLPETEEFALRLLTAHVGWSSEGLTPSVETALLSNYQMAVANGWLGEVGQVASLLASMRMISGKGDAATYAETVLALAPMFEDEEAASFAYLNLAVAELDGGKFDRADKLLTSAKPDQPGFLDEDSDCLSEVDLLKSEVEAARGRAGSARLTIALRKDAMHAEDPIRAAYSARVAALTSDRRGNPSAAKKLIDEAWELAAHHGDWLSRRTIGRTYRQLLNQAPPTHHIR